MTKGYAKNISLFPWFCCKELLLQVICLCLWGGREVRKLFPDSCYAICTKNAILNQGIFHGLGMAMTVDFLVAI